MAETDKIRTERIADQVYARLRNMIVRHELAPGSRLSVPALANRFGVSRSPVREAVLQAVRDGLAVEHPRQGAYVASFEAESLRSFFEVREALEGMSARLAAERRSSAHIVEMRHLFAKQAARLDADDIEGFVEADIELHQAILNASGNPVLQETLGQLYHRLRVALSIRVAPTGPERALADHKMILDAIEAADPEAAEKAARAHIARAIGRILERSLPGKA